MAMTMAVPQHSQPSVYLISLLLLLLPATATSYSSYSKCHFPVPAPDLLVGHHNRSTEVEVERTLPRISMGHFFGGGDLFFAKDQSHAPRSFSFLPRRSVRTTDPTVFHSFATLILEGYGVVTKPPRKHRSSYSATFELQGYYSAAISSTELCMVGSGSYLRHGYDSDDTANDMALAGVVLRLHLPHPFNLTQPFVKGRLEGADADFGVINLVAYEGSYPVAAEHPSSCLSPPTTLVRDERHLLNNEGFSCYRLRELLRGFYSLEWPEVPSSLPLQSPHQLMRINQMSCAGDGDNAVRMYMALYADGSSDSSWLSVGDEALVADGFWEAPRSRLCLRACRVVRSGPSPADLAVGECGIGVSFWFPAAWSLRDRSVAAGLIWDTNTSRASDDDTGTGRIPGVVSMSRSGRYMGDPSDIRYSYTRVEEAKKHCHSKPALREERKGGGGGYPGGQSPRRDFAFRFSLRKQKSSGYASPVTIGSTFVQGNWMMSHDEFSRRVSAEMNEQRLLSVSYDFRFEAEGVEPWSDDETLSRRRVRAEGVYDTETGSLCMAACQVLNGSSDCEVLVTVQFAPVDDAADEAMTEHVVGAISSLRARSDPMIFEAEEFSSHGMYSVQLARLRSRLEVETVMTLLSPALSCALVALQLRHARRHPEAGPGMSVTMLVVLALGHLVPLLLNFEPTVEDRRDRFFHLLRADGVWLEQSGLPLRAATMLAFLLQLRLLQVALSARRSAAAESSGAIVYAEWNTARVCSLLYFLGALLPRIVSSWGENRDQPQLLVLVKTIEPNIPVSYAGLIVDGFLLPQVISNALSGPGGSKAAAALTPWFYAGGTLIRAAPHAYDLYASPRGSGLSGTSAWHASALCVAALLAALLFLQQRPAGAFRCRWKRVRPGAYVMVSGISSSSMTS